MVKGGQEGPRAGEDRRSSRGRRDRAGEDRRCRGAGGTKELERIGGAEGQEGQELGGSEEQREEGPSVERIGEQRGRGTRAGADRRAAGRRDQELEG
uniref:Uncharacterized protein n=1 Tax=Knipowitschia caucasica TaxID=637954 RepID=A0AAV2IUD8_KNICA